MMKNCLYILVAMLAMAATCPVFAASSSLHGQRDGQFIADGDQQFFDGELNSLNSTYTHENVVASLCVNDGMTNSLNRGPVSCVYEPLDGYTCPAGMIVVHGSTTNDGPIEEEAGSKNPESKNPEKKTDSEVEGTKEKPKVLLSEQGVSEQGTEQDGDQKDQEPPIVVCFFQA